MVETGFRPARLMQCVSDLIARLDRNNDLLIHESINQFYYMEKLEEIKFLISRREEAVRSAQFANDLLKQRSDELQQRWRQDIRILRSGTKV